MPIGEDGNTFARTWQFVDQKSAGDAITRADADTALDDIADALNTTIVLTNLKYKGNWDASVGTFPGGGSAQPGWTYTVSVAGTIGAVAFAVGDTITATRFNASTSTYAANWIRKALDWSDGYPSIATIKALLATEVTIGSRVVVSGVADGDFIVLSGSAASNSLTADDVTVVENTAGDTTFVRTLFHERRDIRLQWYGPPLTGLGTGSTEITTWLASCGALATDDRPVTAVWDIPVDVSTAHAIPNNVYIDGRGKGLATVLSSMSLTAKMFYEASSPTSGTRNARNLGILNLTIDGAGRSYPVWLSQADGTAITDPENDYSTPGTIDAGQYSPATIDSVVAADRRNAAATTTQGYIAYFRGVDGAVVEGCTIKNHGRFSVVFAGCINHSCQWNIFDNCGAVDISSNAILDGADGSYRWITGITKANPAVVTVDSMSSAFANGGEIDISDVLGMIEVDGRYKIANISSNTFELQTTASVNVNSTAYTTFAFDGRATVGTADTLFSENSTISHNEFRDLKRAAIQYTGRRGLIHANRIFGAMEGGIFLVRALDAKVTENQIFDVTIADIVASAIEANQICHTEISDNICHRVDMTTLSIVGAYACDISRNDCYRAGNRGALTRPYGPFGERYNYSSAPQISGIAVPANERIPIKSYSYNTLPNTGCICGNRLRDDRATSWNDAAIMLTTSGATSLTYNMSVEDNDMRTWPTTSVIDLIDYGSSVVVPQTLSVRNNKKHTSQSAFYEVRALYASGTTGNQDITCGFPPSAIEVWAFAEDNVNTFPGRFSNGAVHRTHATQGASAANVVGMAWDGTNPFTNVGGSVLAGLYTAAGGTSWYATFVQWNKDGFRLTIPTSTVACQIIARCYP